MKVYAATMARRFQAAFLRGNIAARPLGAVAAVLLGTFMTSFFTRSFAIGLADLRGVYNLSVDEGAWLSTITTAPQLLIAPAIPLAVLTFGARRILVIAGLGFAVTATLTPFAQGLPEIFVLHALDGLLLGCFVPATLATVFANLNPRWWMIALGAYTVRLTLTLHSGVGLTGFYVEGGYWQAIYWQAAVSALVLVGLAAFSIPDRPMNHSLWKHTNKGEIALFCVGLALFYTGLDQGNRLDWFASGFVMSALAGGLFMAIASVAWQHISPLPFAHPRALARPNLAIPLIVVTLYGLMSAATSLLIPNFLSTVAQLKAEQSGRALWWISAIQVLAIPATIWLLRRADPRLGIVIGLCAMMIGCWLGSFITNVWRTDDFTAVSIVLGIGNAFTFLSLVTIVVANARREEIVAVVAYIQIPRVVGPELAGAVVNTLLRKREAVHSVLLGSYVNHPRMEALGIPVRAVAKVIRQEAYVLAYADAYRLCFGVALCSLLLTAGLRRTPANPLTTAPTS
jgi:DHA2 family multidrug resistance protein